MRDEAQAWITGRCIKQKIKAPRAATNGQQCIPVTLNKRCKSSQLEQRTPSQRLTYWARPADELQASEKNSTSQPFIIPSLRILQTW